MEQDGPFARVGIAGLGLIGGSIARAARRAWPRTAVVGFDQDEATAASARRDVVDATVSRLADLDGTDLVVLALPVAAMVEAMPVLARFSRPAVVTDAGSTKREVVRAAAAAGLSSYVGGHPMAGSERSGLDQARADLFDGRPWFLVPGQAPSDENRRVERFVAGLGGVPHWTDADTHDRAVAYLSHLPQIVSVALMNAAASALDGGGLSARGRAFDEMTRLAASPVDMWQPILSGNADFVAEALKHFLSELPGAGDLGDTRWVREAFDRARAARATLVEGRPAR